MTNPPLFFVPEITSQAGIDTTDAEAIYKELAELCGRSALPLSQRIYSITYRHNGQEWTATVGQQLRGERYELRKVHGQKMEFPVAISDPAVVLAIFPGIPFVVVTNHRFDKNVRSAWENPFFAGEPRRVILFSV